MFQGSTYVNSIYGQVNRTGLTVAGAALLGVSGNLSSIVYQMVNYMKMKSYTKKFHINKFYNLT